MARVSRGCHLSQHNLCWLDPFLLLHDHHQDTSPSTAWSFLSTGRARCACYRGICSQALTMGITLTCCRPRDFYPLDSFPTIIPCPLFNTKPPLPLLWSQLQNPFARRPCAYCGDTNEQFWGPWRGDHLWPSRLSLPTPHHA